VCLITAQIGAMQPDEAHKATNNDDDDGLGECSADIALHLQWGTVDMLERKTAAYLTCRPFLTAGGLVGWEVKPAEDGAVPNGELRVFRKLMGQFKLR